MKTIQRLRDYEALRKFSIDETIEYSIDDIQSNIDWTTSNGSLTVQSDNFYTDSHYVLEISPNSLSDVVLTLSLDSVLETEDINSLFVFTAVFYNANNNISVKTRLYDVIGSPDNTGITKTIQAGTWGAVRSNQFLTVEPSGVYPSFYNLEITISNHNGSKIRMSTPNLVNDSAWMQNPVIVSMRPYIPAFYAEYDSLQEEPRYPMYRFIDVLTDAIADTMFLYSEWFEYDNREVPRGVTKSDPRMRSRLTDYGNVRDEFRPWLAQFSGSRIKKQIYDGSNAIIASGDIDDFITWQLNPAGYGYSAGTQRAIVEAVQFVLTDTKGVIISQIYDGDPWSIQIVTLTSESPDSSVVLAAAEPARPMGYQFVHNTVAEFTLTLGDPIYGRLGTAVL